jgi:hypothetical protein
MLHHRDHFVVETFKRCMLVSLMGSIEGFGQDFLQISAVEFAGGEGMRMRIRKPALEPAKEMIWLPGKSAHIGGGNVKKVSLERR